MNIIEEIVYSPTLSLWKSKFDLTHKDILISECEKLIKSRPDNKTDAYTYYINNGLKYNGKIDIEIINELDKVLHSGLETCIKIYGKNFNELKTDSWVNIVRAKNPVQKNFKKENIIFHDHVDLNIKNGLPPPFYTFVSYIQMPNNLMGDDGVLFIQDIDKKVYTILPEEGDIIIMKGDLPHSPNVAPNSNFDRIVLAGSVRMDLSKLNKSII